MFAGSQPFASQSQNPFGSSPQAEDKKPRQEEKQTVLPTTVRAVEMAVSRRQGDADLEMFGSAPSLVVLLGVVEAPDIQASSAHFVLNDSTGRLPVRCFAAEAIAESMEECVKAGAYVVATGQVRFSPDLHFTAIQLRSVKSGDEVAYHMIEAAHAALKLRVAPPPLNTPAAVKTAAPNVAPQTTAPSPASAPPAEAKAGVSSQEVLGYLSSVSEDRPEGVSRAAIKEQFPGSTEPEIQKLLEELVASGDAFTTIDDDHFSAV